MVASPSLLLGSLRWSPRPSSGQRGSARSASAWLAKAKLHPQAAQLRVRALAGPNVSVPCPSVLC
eukprot:7768363-Alexandrium_andersonii.AAC.1